MTGVADRLSSLREERPSAGTRYRLMGAVADITEVTEVLSKEVLERVKHVHRGTVPVCTQINRGLEGL